MTDTAKKIRPRDCDLISKRCLQAWCRVSALFTFRLVEIAALVRDVDRVAKGGAAARFVIGEYGAGKTFLATLFG
jgi:hypothetical protein